MNCPECGQQMWNYEVGQMRCANDHVFAIEALEGVQARVIRIDLPSRMDRLRDFTIGVGIGCLATSIGQILAYYL